MEERGVKLAPEVKKAIEKVSALDVPITIGLSLSLSAAWLTTVNRTDTVSRISRKISIMQELTAARSDCNIEM